MDNCYLKVAIPDFEGTGYYPELDRRKWLEILADPHVKNITRTQVEYTDYSYGPTPYTERLKKGEIAWLKRI